MNKTYNPKVSVIIITYNQEDLIGDTLDSVLLQGYENIEIIVADDCSTDKTRDVILDYKRLHTEKIKPVFNDENLGITGNSNAALNAATGELVAILGGDDLFLSGKITKQAALFEDENIVLSYHAVDVFLHKTDETIFLTNQTEREDLNDVYEVIEKGGIPGASSVMVRRSACPPEGFNEGLPVVSDWLFFIEVARKGDIAKLEGVYGRYRKHGKGASERTYELLDESLRALEITIEKYGDGNERLRSSCYKGMHRYIAGEIYRQLVKGNNHLAYKLSQRMHSVGELSLKYKSLVFLSFMAHRLPLAGLVLKLAIKNMKNVLKRHVA